MFKKHINNGIIELLEKVDNKIKLGIDKLTTEYIYIEPKKCPYLKETNGKPCNKKIIKDGHNHCRKHTIQIKLIENESKKNNNIHDFELEHYKDNLYKDFFNNLFKIEQDSNEGEFIGFIRDGEIVLKII